MPALSRSFGLLLLAFAASVPFSRVSRGRRIIFRPGQSLLHWCSRPSIEVGVAARHVSGDNRFVRP